MGRQRLHFPFLMEGGRQNNAGRTAWHGMRQGMFLSVTVAATLGMALRQTWAGIRHRQQLHGHGVHVFCAVSSVPSIFSYKRMTLSHSIQRILPPSSLLSSHSSVHCSSHPYSTCLNIISRRDSVAATIKRRGGLHKPKPALVTRLCLAGPYNTTRASANARSIYFDARSRRALGRRHSHTAATTARLLNKITGCGSSVRQRDNRRTVRRGRAWRAWAGVPPEK